MPLTRSPALVVVAALALAACQKSTTTPGITPRDDTPVAPYKLKWSDEFDGAAGAPVDPTKWVGETGGSGWGNQERQFYTTSASNAALDGSGNLVITARAEPANSPLTCWYGRCRYTSARIKTQGRFEQAYGKFEARIRIPRGQGLWPAFWMLGSDIERVGWPKSGEIDIMENIGKEPSAVYGTLHGPGYSGDGAIGGAYTLAAQPFSDDYHVFSVEWSPTEIRWLVDEREYRRTAHADLPAGGVWVFDHAFFMLLNVAVGGNWPGDPDATTT
ncbi:MAG: glycoside hydrolase family 16 protein, partial [bacterium]